MGRFCGVPLTMSEDVNGVEVKAAFLAKGGLSPRFANSTDRGDEIWSARFLANVSGRISISKSSPMAESSDARRGNPSISGG